MKQFNLYIPSIEAKDIIAAQNQKNCSEEENLFGYSLFNNKGEYNLKKFKNSFDFSLDLIELDEEITEKVYGNKETFSFIANKGKVYSDKIINVTFKYSLKDFNKVSGNIFVKTGYSYKKLDFVDCIAYEDDEIVGIITDTIIQDYKSAIEISKNLPKGFCCKKDINGCFQYKCIEKVKGKSGKDDLGLNEELTESGNIKVISSTNELRNKLYTDGFICNGVKYVRFKRSSGSARVGKCLFIDERLYEYTHKSEKCGLEYKENDEIDLAAIEAYIALTSSSIVDVINIKPENILVVDDFESVFDEEAVVTEADEEGNLHTEQRVMRIKNSIWDGQSLIDISLLGDTYSSKGMVLLRNKFFKSCCFNANIQKWFKDNNITKVSQLNGHTIARRIEDVKLITTPSSIKYFKFGKFETWLDNIYPMFGVVKYDKNTHFFGGELVQAHYQLINTLQLSEDDISKLVKPGLDYITLLNSDMDVFRYHMKCKVQNGITSNVMKDTNEIVYKMINFKGDFENTELFHKFKKELRTSYINNMKRGHLLINGTYATLFGNPLEMLQQAIGKYEPNTSSIPVGCVHNTRYKYDTEILGCRSPHVTMGNLFIAKNIEVPEIDKYFNLTPQIICINSVNENTLERLSGADFDSDQMIISNEKILIEAAKKNYSMFKVPTSNVHASKAIRHYTKSDLADLDIKTGKNKIGEIINLSQELNSIIWNKISLINRINEQNKKNGIPLINVFDEIKDIYFDVCQLDVMSCIEIDKAKKEFTVDNTKELNKLRLKYKDILVCEDNLDGLQKRMKPKFLGYIAKTKGYYNRQKHVYIYQDTAMDYLHRQLTKFRVPKKSTSFVPFSQLFIPVDYNSKQVNYKQIREIIDYMREAQAYIKSVWSTESHMLSSTEKLIYVNDKKEEVCEFINDKEINEHTMYKLITLVDAKEYSDISRFLMTTLFNYKNEQIINILKDKEKINTQLVQDANGNINIYGIKFAKMDII